MRKRKTFKIVIITAILLAMGSFGVLATTDSGIFSGGEYSIHTQNSGRLSGHPHFADTAIARWVDYGVLPMVSHSEADSFVTYGQFAQIMHNLLNYTINERYTHISYQMYIRRFEAFTIIAQAMGRSPGLGHTSFTDNSQIPPHARYYISSLYQNGIIMGFPSGHAYELLPNDFLTFGQLAVFLDSLVQVFIADDTLINLEDIYLDAAMVINNSDNISSIVALNINGRGDIIIAPNQSGQILFDSINTTGNIIIAQSGHSMNIVINNSAAQSLRFLGQSNVSLINYTQIDAAHMSNKSKLDISLLTDSTSAPEIFITGPHVELAGDFYTVRSTLNNEIIFIDGNIANLYADGNIILLGTGDIQHTIAPFGVFASIICPRSLLYSPANADIGQLLLLNALNSRMDEMMYALEYLLYDLLSEDDDDEDDQDDPHPPFIGLPNLPQIPQQPGPNPDNRTPINDINIHLMPPNLLPPALFPPNLTSNVQRNITGNGFSGTITWANINGSPLTGNHFTPGEIYIATVSLTPATGRYFALDAEITTEIFGDAWHRIVETPTDNFTQNAVVFSLIFDPLSRVQAEAFTLRNITGPFTRIYIYTHYLGQPTPGNFLVTFDNAPIGIIAVGRYNEIGGYYAVALNQMLIPNGSVLSVEMTGELPYHIPYPTPATTIPQPMAQ
ncbi:MAG: S-layer homology domain-containing protein [Defluviitaleaceae bacterium]|nr:S-layer homology domain-containing protein [Defluviitaleaceae bacterium]